MRGTAASIQYVPCISCSRNFMNISYSNQCSSGVLGPGTPSDFFILGFTSKPLLLLIQTSVFKDSILFMCMCTCMCDMYTDTHRGQKTAVGFSGAAIRGTGNQTSALRKSRKCFQPYHHRSHLCCGSGPPARLVFPSPLPGKSTIMARSTHTFWPRP